MRGLNVFAPALLATSLIFAHSLERSDSLFKADQHQPYHLSMGAVLFNQEGKIACHHFKEIFGYEDIYILMRESMENDETPLVTLNRGLMEEFGASAETVAFLGCISGNLYDTPLTFEKTTLYFACKVVHWDPALRDSTDPESYSLIEWHEPHQLMEYMQKQGARYGRIDVDESEMIRRALPYLRSLE